MIHFIFISPDAFEKLGNQFGEKDGLGDLRELLFPRRADPNVLLADPHATNWFTEVTRRAMKLPPQTRGNALALLQRLSNQSLVGWASPGPAPANEGEWVRIACKSKGGCLDWAFTSRIDLCGESIETVDRISDDTWLKKQFPWSKNVPRCRTAQRPIFQKLFMGADWCIAELPFIKGGSDDEVVTFKQLIDVISDLPRTKAFELDLVTKLEDKPAYWAGNVEDELRQTLKKRSAVKIRVFALSKYIDRYFTVGKNVTIAKGQSKREVRRCIAVQHVAIGGNRKAESNNWNLCNSVDTSLRYEKLQVDMAVPGALVFELP
ncbi:MAG TPA: hypothetical protein DDZ51_21855 [Planctomycetaceae bacterium]|nr:hypothetical protein [Planctomycetaceae bacterium]